MLAGLKGGRRVPEFNSDDIVTRQLRVQGVFGVDHQSFVQAVETIRSGRFPLERLHTHAFSLEAAADAIDTLAGETGEPAVNVTIEPWL